jgi:hypothetical protein
MKKLLMTACVLAGIGAATPAFAIPTSEVQYLLSSFVGTGSPASGPYGTVTLDQIGSNVMVTVALDSPPSAGFVDTGAGSALLFNLMNVPTITITGLTAGYTLVSTTNGDIHADGSGDWDFAITCAAGTSPACGTGGSNPAPGPFSFTVDNVLLSQFIPNDSNYYFASDLCIGTVSNTGGCIGATGDVVATAGTVTQVPEPSTLALFGAGLMAFWALRRRIWRAKSTLA